MRTATSLSRMLLLPLLALALVPSTLSASSQHPLSSPSSYSYDPSSSPYTVTGFSRTIELGGATSKTSTVYTLTSSSGRAGEGKSGSAFTFALAEKDADSLSWIEASTGRTANSKKAAEVTSLGYDATRRTHFYSATLPPQSSASTEDITLTVSTVQNHYSYPKPAAVTQDSLLQGMYWTGDLLSGSSALLVPSKLDASAVKVRVKSPTPRCNEEVVPDGWKAQHTTGSSIITFTLDGALELGLSKPSHAAVHYEQPEPVLTLLYLNRTLSISHWADSLSVSESMHLKNSGPELKGTFSRLTHQAIAYMRRQGQGTPHTLTSLNLALPKGVYNPYYIDEIGNVSTSRFRPSLPAQGRLSGFGGNSLLEITPRYPLMGGWNYTCEVGYKQPLGDVLKYDAKKGEYMLEVPFLTPVRGAAIDDVEVRIVLPDGASNPQVQAPFPLSSSSSSLTYSYLDTSGRPTLILSKSACSEKHGDVAQTIYVTYSYGHGQLLRKPVTVAAALLAFFAVAGTARRVRWRIEA